LRNDTGGKWKIVADCWPGAVAENQIALSLSTSEVLELRPLARDIIVEVIHDAGVAGPTELVRELVDQSRGRAGLAVTLAFLCLQGDTRLVGLGRVLAQHVKTTFTNLVGAEGIDALTMLSLGGRSGLALSDVANELGRPVVQIQRAVVQLSAGGVVEEIVGYGGDRRIAVQPGALRDALVSEHFFGKFALALPERIVRAAANDSVTEVLLGAAHRDGSVPDVLLWGRLADHGTPELFMSYAALGEQRAKRVVDERPDVVAHIAPAGLFAAPKLFLPRLLEVSVGDDRDTGSTASHPLRRIEDWVQGGRPGVDAMPRRRILIDAIEDWLRSGGDLDVAIRACSFALVPAFSVTKLDPGAGRTIQLTHGTIRADEVPELAELWRRVIGFISPSRVKNWKPLLIAIRGVASPHTLGGNPGQDLYAACRKLAAELVHNLASAASARPGVLLELSEIAKWLGSEFKYEIDADFVAIYPDEDYDDHGTWFKNANERADALGRRLGEKYAAETAKLLAFYAGEAQAAGSSRNMLFAFGRALADSVSYVPEWIEAFTQICPMDAVIGPLLERLHCDDYDRWLVECGLLLTIDRLRTTAITAILTANRADDRLVSNLLPYLPKHADTVKILCLQRRVNIDLLRKLLTHEHDGVAAAAAWGEWSTGPKGKVRPEVQDCWRSAMLRSGSDRQRQAVRLHVRDILMSDRALAFEWLVARIRDGTPLYELEDYDLDGAIPMLSPEQRLEILIALGSSEVYAPDDFVLRLIAGEVDLYRRLLAVPATRRIHLSALKGRPTPGWEAMAIVALV
jgi:hypothetical protein